MLAKKFWSGLGPYGPLWAHMGPYGPLWGPYGSSWTGPDMTKSRLLVQFRTLRVQNVVFFMKCLDDSASFLPEELKNHIIFTKNPNIWPKIQKIPQGFPKILKIPRFPKVPCGALWSPVDAQLLHDKNLLKHKSPSRRCRMLPWSFRTSRIFASLLQNARVYSWAPKVPAKGY